MRGFVFDVFNDSEGIFLYISTQGENDGHKDRAGGFLCNPEQ